MITINNVCNYNALETIKYIHNNISLFFKDPSLCLSVNRISIFLGLYLFNCIRIARGRQKWKSDSVQIVCSI